MQFIHNSKLLEAQGGLLSLAKRLRERFACTSVSLAVSVSVFAPNECTTQRYRQAGRQTDGQTDRHLYTHIQRTVLIITRYVPENSI